MSHSDLWPCSSPFYHYFVVLLADLTCCCVYFYVKINSKLRRVKWRNKVTHKRSCCTMKAVDKTCLWCFPTYFSSSSSFICHCQHHQVSLPSLSHLLFFICIFCSLLRYLCCLPEGVDTAQTQWSRGSRWSGWRKDRNWPLSSLSSPTPNPGGSEKVQTFQAGWEVEDKERDRGLREDCVTVEAVNNWLLSSNSFRLLAALQSCLKLMHIHFTISQELCGRLEQ